MSSRQKFIPGVLGGMGPQATVDFMAKLVSQTQAQCDQDHIRILVDHNPGVPNRHEAIAGDGSEVKAALVDMARRMERAGADFLLMVCNTAHAFQEDIRVAVDIPFISIVDEAVSALDTRASHARRIGVMAAEGCLAAGLYQNALEQMGREAVMWSDAELDQFMSIVYQIKAGDAPDQLKLQMEQLAQVLVERGAEALIAGCTEIPLVLGDSDILSVPLLSSTDILVSRTINYALGDIALPIQ
ncbi:MAG: amino acid racemase [Proteobacteria bacterium]|nr:amino acid racemase [Pseudomonadota bacterium]